MAKSQKRKAKSQAVRNLQSRTGTVSVTCKNIGEAVKHATDFTKDADEKVKVNIEIFPTATGYQVSITKRTPIE